MLIKGQNKKVEQDTLKVLFENKHRDLSIYAIVLDESATVVYDKSKSFGDAVHLLDDTVSIDLSKLSSNVSRVVLAISAGNNNSFATVPFPVVKINASTQETFVIDEQDTTKAMIVAEAYPYKGEWKYRVLSSGFKQGMSQILDAFDAQLIPDKESVDVPSNKTSTVINHKTNTPSVSPSESNPALPLSREPETRKTQPGSEHCPPPDLDEAIKLGVNMFKKIFAFGSKSAEDLKTGVIKFKSKDFLRACIAGSFMVAAADGSIDESEKKKLLAFIKSDDALSVFDTDNVITIFQEFENAYSFDNDAGNAKALKEIAKIANNKEQAKFLIRMIIAIGASDGDFDKDERLVVRNICRELSIDPSEFNL